MNEMTLRARYATFVLSSVIGTLFAIVIALLMFANLVHSVPDPLTTPQYVTLREQLRADRQRVAEGGDPRLGSFAA